MGHFSARAIRLSFAAAVYPSLLLTYLGQTAMILNRCGGGEHAGAHHIRYPLGAALALPALCPTLCPLSRPEAAAHSYWESVPGPMLWPAVVIATIAATLASQALITGTFSILQQA